MSKKRIYEVAADYGKHVNEVLDLLKKHNITKPISAVLMNRLWQLFTTPMIKT